jgi:hypothetical protein
MKKKIKKRKSLHVCSSFMLRFYYIILSVALCRFYYNFTFSDLTFSISPLMDGVVNCEYLYDTVQLWFLLSFSLFPIKIAWFGLGGQCVNRDTTVSQTAQKCSTLVHHDGKRRRDCTDRGVQPHIPAQFTISFFV